MLASEGNGSGQGGLRSQSERWKLQECRPQNSPSVKLSRAWEQRMFPERQTATHFYARGNIKKQHTTGHTTQHRNHPGQTLAHGTFGCILLNVG